LRFAFANLADEHQHHERHGNDDDDHADDDRDDDDGDDHRHRHKVPNTVDGPGIAGLLTSRLGGTPADGSPPPGKPPKKVVWVDGGDSVLVHLDSTTTQIVGQTVLVSIDLESDQTGRTPLVVAFALPADDAAGLVVATDEYPRGNGLLASRWGAAVQAAAWSALLSLASDHAAERGLAPRGLAISSGRLHLLAGQPLRIG
jgi:hypothetical protein